MLVGIFTIDDEDVWIALQEIELQVMVNHIKKAAENLYTHSYLETNAAVVIQISVSTEGSDRLSCLRGMNVTALLIETLSSKMRERQNKCWERGKTGTVYAGWAEGNLSQICKNNPAWELNAWNSNIGSREVDGTVV
jgi:post-segregation antitoxin (ccd killing protein)